MSWDLNDKKPHRHIEGKRERAGWIWEDLLRLKCLEFGKRSDGNEKRLEMQVEARSGKILQ